MATSQSSAFDHLKPETQNWLGLANESYDDALYMFAGARRPGAVYHICQAIEKLLKAAIVEFQNQVPKKIHDLEILAHQSGLKFSEEQTQILRDLTTHYERVRYRDLAQNHYITKKKARPVIDQAKTIYLWIQKQFTNH